MKYTRRTGRCENHFRREVLAQLTARPVSFLDSAETEVPAAYDPFVEVEEALVLDVTPRPAQPLTVFAYLRRECGRDVAGRKATRAIFSLRWPLLYAELLHSENVIHMTVTEADGAEAELRAEYRRSA